MNDPMTELAIDSRTRVVYAVGAAGRAGTLARELGARRALLVTDPGVAAAGHAETVRASLEAAGIETVVFGEVHENPTARDVDACLEVARGAQVDLLVGVGGGSSIDAAKGCNFLLTNGGSVADYWGFGKASHPLLPLLAVPTTAGTGSEVQSFALIADDRSHQKMACGDPKAAPAVAILDPVLTLTQPRRVTTCAGIDALSHAIESAVTANRTHASTRDARQAFALVHRGFRRVLRDPNDLEARGCMLLGAAFAGAAIEKSMLGAAHAAANPLTAHFDVTHGQAVGMMLPHVVRYNAGQQTAAEGYARLAEAAGMKPDELEPWLEATLAEAGLVRTLGELGVPHDALPLLAEEAARQWTARFNPRPAGAEEFRALYESAYDRAGSGRGLTEA